MPQQEESNSILARLVAACLVCSCCKNPETLESNAIGTAPPPNLNPVQNPTPPLPLRPQVPPPVPVYSSPLPSAPPLLPGEPSSSQSAAQQSLPRVDSIDEQLAAIPDFLAKEWNDAVEKSWVHFPDLVQPIHYKLKLIPNLEERKPIYWGEIEITFELKTNTNQIPLHSSGHKIRTVQLKIIGADGDIAVTYELRPVEKWLIISAQRRLVAHTIYQLKVVFDGRFSTVPFGFFLQTFVLETKTYQVYANVAATQFEPEFAKLAFPCFERIDYRATFSLSIARYEDETAISNLHVVAVGKADNNLVLDGRVWDTFESTETVPLYAVSFAIMNHEYKHVGTSNANKPTSVDKVVVWTIPELRDQVYYALETAKLSVEFMETITATKFVSGRTSAQLERRIHLIQMQNTGKVETIEEYQWSPILHRESNLLCHTDKCPELHIEMVTLTVARKISFHWFGRFITSWSYSWLKNGFGKYFEFKLVDMMKPLWRMSELHGTVEMQTVMFEDGRSVLYPISPLEPVSSDCIIHMYSISNFEILNGKAALYLRMLEKIVGQSTFLRAIQKFALTGNRNDGTITASDLWTALQRQIVNDNIVRILHLPENETITSIMNTWISWVGYPLITTRLILKPDGKFVLFISQSQYANASQQPQDERVVPITMTTERASDFRNTTPIAWLKGTRMELPINISQGEWYILNIQNTAYIRVNYADGNWERLIKRLCTANFADISAVNRAQLIADAHVLAIDGKLSLNIPIIMISYLTRETDAVVWLAAIQHVKNMYFALSQNTRPKYKQYFFKILKTEYRRTGFIADPTDDHVKKIWRGVMLSIMSMFEDEDCVQEAERIYKQHDDILSIDPNLQYAVFCAMVRKYEVKNLSESEQVPAHVLLQRRLTGISSNIVQQLKNLAFVSGEPCQKTIFEKALNCREFKWKNPNYNFFKTLLGHVDKMTYDKFDERINAILSQWDSIYHILQFIERMITEWTSSPPSRSDVGSLIKILRYLIRKVQGNPELNTLDRIINTMNSFDGKIYRQLYDVLIYVRNTAKQGGKRELDENGIQFPINTNQCVKLMGDRLNHANP